jgi:hypothetical protein
MLAEAGHAVDYPGVLATDAWCDIISGRSPTDPSADEQLAIWRIP